MKRFLLTAIAIISTYVASTQGSQVQWGAAESNGIGLANGTPVALGSLVLLGYFNLTTTQIVQNATNEAFLMANFVQYASSVIGAGAPNGTGDNTGYWSQASVNSSNTLNVQNKQIYYWLFNAPTATAATQYGIFLNPGAGNWTFQDDAAIPSLVVNDLSNVPHNSTGILFGSYGTGTSNDGFSPLFNLAAIPEPSSVALAFAGLGLIPLCRLRRKK